MLQVFAGDEPLKKYPVTASPSGKYHLETRDVIQTVSGKAGPGMAVGTRLILLGKDEKPVSECMSIFPFRYDFDEGRFQAKVFWNAGESVVAICHHGRMWSQIDLFGIRGAQITPYPLISYDAIARDTIKNCKAVERPFITFTRWLSPDTFEASFSGQAYVGAWPIPQPPHDLSDPAKFQDFSLNIKVQASFEGIHILEVKAAPGQ